MWFPRFAKNRRSACAPSRRPSFRPRLEALEDRCLMNAGALDPTFGAGAGYVTTSLSSGTDTPRQVLLQPSGNIVVAGETSVPVTTTTTSKGKTTTTTKTVYVMGAATYNPDGSLDAAFGSGGVVQQPFAGTSSGVIYGAGPGADGCVGRQQNPAGRPRPSAGRHGPDAPEPQRRSGHHFR